MMSEVMQDNLSQIMQHKFPQTKERADALIDLLHEQLYKACSYINVCIQASDREDKEVCDLNEVLKDAKDFLNKILSLLEHVTEFIQHHFENTYDEDSVLEALKS
jgi:hypothetical protein